MKTKKSHPAKAGWLFSWAYPFNTVPIGWCRIAQRIDGGGLNDLQ
jgi:hypothetical protein